MPAQLEGRMNDLCSGVFRIKSARPDISIVIVTWNVAGDLEKCLGSLGRLGRDFAHEVIVVDNASVDGTAQMVREQFPRVTLIENKTNVGYAAANNQGIAIASGRHVLLLNPDTVAPEGALGRLVRAMDKDETIGVATPVLTNERGERQFYGESFYPGARRRAVGGAKGSGRGDFREMAFVIGAAMTIRREVLERIGGLDGGFFMYYEDVDFCKRARGAGWKVGVFETIQIVHVKGGSARQLGAGEKARRLFQSELRFHRKHYSRLKTWRLLMTRCAGTLWCLCWYGTLGRVCSKDAAAKRDEYKGRLRVLLGAGAEEGLGA